MKTTLQTLGYSRGQRRHFGRFFHEHKGSSLVVTEEWAPPRSTLSGVRLLVALQTVERAERDKRGVKFLPAQVVRRAFADSRI